MEHYKKIEERFAQVTALQQVDSLLNWDRSVTMPEQGNAQRARQAAVLNVKIHQLQTDPRIGEWIAAVDRKSLSDWQRANLRVIEFAYAHATAVPEDLVERKMLQAAKTEMTWRKARAESDFALVRDELAALFAIMREVAAAKSEKLGRPAYDVMMETYAPGIAVAEVDMIFDDLARFLPGFVARVQETQKKPLPLPAVPVERQKAFGQELIRLLGFGQGWGRLDVSAHPFSMGIGGDVRITTRYLESDFTSALQGIAHEAGHGFYDHHTPQEWAHQPVGASQNMGMAAHESQSLIYDMQLGRSRAYWEFLAPRAQKSFGLAGPALSAENLYAHAVRVAPSFIRVEADEVTYPLHIILRYRLEKDIVAGRLAVRDLPEAWNAGMKDLLGIAPPDDRNGCLQDIHWHAGYVGYFPAYALGAIIAAQYAACMRRDIPGLDAHIREGNFAVFNNWLRDNVQSRACLLSPPDLIRQVTGGGLSVAAFKNHLTGRYLGEEPCSATSAPAARRPA